MAGSEGQGTMVPVCLYSAEALNVVYHNTLAAKLGRYLLDVLQCGCNLVEAPGLMNSG